MMTPRRAVANPRRHDRRYQGPDDQRAGPVPVQADGEHDHHHDPGGGAVRMKDGQAHQQQRHDNNQDAQRHVTAPQL
jgi:hypothetical protein